MQEFVRTQRHVRNVGICIGLAGWMEKCTCVQEGFKATMTTWSRVLFFWGGGGEDVTILQVCKELPACSLPCLHSSQPVPICFFKVHFNIILPFLEAGIAQSV